MARARTAGAAEIRRRARATRASRHRLRLPTRRWRKCRSTPAAMRSKAACRRAARALLHRHRRVPGSHDDALRALQDTARAGEQCFRPSLYPRLAGRRRAGALRRHHVAGSVSSQEYPEPDQRHRSGRHRAHRGVQRRIPRALWHALGRRHRHHATRAQFGLREPRCRQPDLGRSVERSARASAGRWNGCLPCAAARSTCWSRSKRASASRNSAIPRAGSNDAPATAHGPWAGCCSTMKSSWARTDDEETATARYQR